MSTLASFFRLISGRQVRKSNGVVSCLTRQLRTFADTPKTDTSSKQVVTQGSEIEERVRVRRARVSDVPRILRFVKEHARATWPGLVSSSSSHLMLCDYIARALAQGHSMLAERQEPRRGWSQIRGLALGSTVCAWDPGMLEKWARCIRCPRSRRLMYFTAHCLRAPALHDKYKVHSILQVILIVPKETQKNGEIIHTLAKNSIQRGKDVGFSLIRFDVADDAIAKYLEVLELKKEWQFKHEASQDKDNTLVIDKNEEESDNSKQAVGSNYLAVYTALTQDKQKL